MWYFQVAIGLWVYNPIISWVASAYSCTIFHWGDWTWNSWMQLTISVEAKSTDGLWIQVGPEWAKNTGWNYAEPYCVIVWLFLTIIFKNVVLEKHCKLEQKGTKLGQSEARSSDFRHLVGRSTQVQTGASFKKKK